MDNEYDHFIIYIFFVTKNEDVNFPFVFLNDYDEPCLYVLGKGKDHS